MYDDRQIKFENSGWNITCLIDDDNHLNIYITNEFSNEIYEIETGQGDGIGEQLAQRFTTKKIEDDYSEDIKAWVKYHKV